MTYYAQLNGSPITGASAAKTLSSLDSQTMALTLGHFVQVQAERKQCFVFKGVKFNQKRGLARLNIVLHKKSILTGNLKLCNFIYNENIV